MDIKNITEYKIGIPTGILITAEVIKQFQHEQIFNSSTIVLIINILLFAFAVSCMIVKEKTTERSQRTDINNFICNVYISSIATIINTYIFGLHIHLETLQNDIWSIHLIWVIVIIVQVLLLTSVGNGLIKLFQKVTSTTHRIYQGIFKYVSSLFKTLCGINKKKILVVCACTIVSLMYLVGEYILQANNYNLMKSTIIVNTFSVWLIVYCITILVQRTSFISLEGQNIKKLLIIILFVFILFYALNNSDIIQSVGKSISMILIPLFIIGIYTITNASKAKNTQKNSSKKIAMIIYFLFIVIAFVILPMIVLCIFTILRPEGQKIIMSQSLSDFSTWINLLNLLINTAEYLLPT